MNNRRSKFVVLSVIIGLLLISTIAAAQEPPAVTDLRIAENGSVGGVVKDTTSAIIPGVTVTMTNTQTGVVQTQLTNGAGVYSFPNVPRGTYKLSGDLTGFSSDIRNNIQVGSSNQIRVDLVLRASTPALSDLTVSYGSRLAWTAPSGTGYTYVIERSGPGLTLYTQVAGPITETSYVVDTDRSEFEGGASYTYRVRVVDAASNKGPASNTVQVRSTRVRNLPLVGNNVLDLLAILPGYRMAARPDDAVNRSFALETAKPDSVSVLFTAVRDRTLSFTSADGSQSFSWGCADCSIIVGPDGVGPTRGGNRGAIFKLSPDGSTIMVTCRAVKCDVVSAQEIDIENGKFLRAFGNISERSLAAEGTITIPATQRALLTVNTR